MFYEGVSSTKVLLFLHDRVEGFESFKTCLSSNLLFRQIKLLS